jgi:hypothetical protein
MGYSILSLEASENGKRSRYCSPAAMVATLEESIMDHILKKRDIPFRPDAEPYTKRKLLSDMLVQRHRKRCPPDATGTHLYRLGKDCIFSTKGIPQPRLDVYAQVARQAVIEKTASHTPRETLNIASISETIFGVAIDPAIEPEVIIHSQ